MYDSIWDIIHSHPYPPLLNQKLFKKWFMKSIVIQNITFLYSLLKYQHMSMIVYSFEFFISLVNSCLHCRQDCPKSSKHKLI